MLPPNGYGIYSRSIHLIPEAESEKKQKMELNYMSDGVIQLLHFKCAQVLKEWTYKKTENLPSHRPFFQA